MTKNVHRPAALLALVAGVVLLLLALASGSVQAATAFTVNRSGDASDDAKPNDNPLHLGNNAVIKVQIKGTDAGAEANGLRITAPDSTVRGLAINRFARSGLLVAGSLATGNEVEGNFIGTDASGTRGLPNVGNGVRINGAPDNTIGGTEPAQSNLLSGSGSDGVELGGSGAKLNKVEGNYIGTDASGTQDLGNAGDGVRINGAPDNTIGPGTVFNGANLIARNDSDGISITGSAATGNTAGINRIEENSGHGVRIEEGASDNTIGQGGAGNSIVDNGGDGVLVASGTGNRISPGTNGFGGNGGLGIDLSGGTEDSFGVTANDVDPDGTTDDADEGANELQNFPVITSAVQPNPDLFCSTIEVEFHSTPDQTFTVQFFEVVDSDPSFHGEGVTYAGHTTTATDADGDGSFSFINCAIAGDEMITATATNTATGDTSEFSRNFIVGPPG